MTTTDGARTELYGLALEEFTTARQRLARAARADGDRATADEIAGLRKPSRAAWVVNLVTRHRPGLVSELQAVGEALRTAQRQLAGDELRRLAATRRQCVGALVAGARQVAEEAGHDPTPATLREVESTAQAALGSAETAATVFSGHLERAVDAAGTGVGESDGATMPATLRSRTGTSAPPPHLTARSPNADVGAGPVRASEGNRAQLRAATAALEEAVAGASRARQLVEDLVSRRAELRAELESLRREEVERNATLRKAEQAERNARRAVERAEAALARSQDAPVGGRR